MNYIYKKMIGGLFAKLKAVLSKVGIPENLCLPVAALVAVAVIAGAVYYFLGDKIVVHFLMDFRGLPGGGRRI